MTLRFLTLVFALILSAASCAQDRDLGVTLEAIAEDLLFDPQRDRLYVSVPGLRAVLAVDATTLETLREYPLSGAPEHVNLSLDNNRLLVALGNIGKVAVIDIASGSTRDIDVSAAIDGVAVSEVVEAIPGRLVAVADIGDGFGGPRASTLSGAGLLGKHPRDSVFVEDGAAAVHLSTGRVFQRASRPNEFGNFRQIVTTSDTRTMRPISDRVLECGFDPDDFDAGIRAMEVSDDGRYLYLVDGFRICRSSTAVNEPLDPVAGFAGAPHSMAVDDRRSLVYVSVPSRQEVITLDRYDLSIVRRTTIPGGPSQLRLRDDGRTLEVRLITAEDVVLLDLETGLVSSVEVDRDPATTVYEVVAPLSDRELLVRHGARGMDFLATLKYANNRTGTLVDVTSLSPPLWFDAQRRRLIAEGPIRATSVGTVAHYGLARTGFRLGS